MLSPNICRPIPTHRLATRAQSSRARQDRLADTLARILFLGKKNVGFYTKEEADRVANVVKLARHQLRLRTAGLGDACDEADRLIRQAG